VGAGAKKNGGGQVDKIGKEGKEKYRGGKGGGEKAITGPHVGGRAAAKKGGGWVPHQKNLTIPCKNRGGPKMVLLNDPGGSEPTKVEVGGLFGPGERV